MSLLIASVTLGRHAWCLGEYILEKLTNSSELASPSALIPRTIGLFVFYRDISQIVLHDFDVFWGLANLDEGSNENGVVVKLHNVVRSVHIYLNFVLLEFFEFVFVKMVGEGALSATKMAPQDKELVLTSLM